MPQRSNGKGFELSQSKHDAIVNSIPSDAGVTAGAGNATAASTS